MMKKVAEHLINFRLSQKVNDIILSVSMVILILNQFYCNLSNRDELWQVYLYYDANLTGIFGLILSNLSRVRNSLLKEVLRFSLVFFAIEIHYSVSQALGFVPMISSVVSYHYVNVILGVYFIFLLRYLWRQKG